MQKGEQIDHFLSRLQEIRDQLNSIGATSDEELMVRIALNTVFEESETFIQSILGRAILVRWEELWAVLCQKEIKRLTMAGSSNKGTQVKKEEEEDATLASVEQQGNRKKKDLSYIKCFNCGELGHYATQCPRNKNKGEASDSKAVPAKAEKEL